MILSRFIAILGVAVSVCASSGHAADSAIPSTVPESGISLTNRVSGVPPFYVKRTSRGDGTVVERTILYPLFYSRYYGPNYEWSVFKLINHFGRRDGVAITPATNEQDLDVWPFYFSSEVRDDPSSTYHAVFPIVGTIPHRFFRDRISWVVWPLYLQTEKSGAVTTSTPWPILHWTRGAATGFALWPIYGWEDRPGVYRRHFYLWPLGWNNVRQPKPDGPPGLGPVHESGFLPFYTSERGTGLVNENYLWPFFGFTDRTIPVAYHETRYFWPFAVQGHGDHYVDRWGPFYTHSIARGSNKTWVMWPLWRRLSWHADGVAQTKRQFFYFFYWSLEQQSLANPAAPPAYKTHYWPLLSVWDNGAGRRQWQFLSPLEVFFPSNDEMRRSWNPFFALVRHDRRAPGVARTSVLWGAITWESGPAQNEAASSRGPLLAVVRSPRERRVALFGGLIGWSRRPAAGWQLFALEFSRNDRTLSARSR
jgi:hypothetical protein